MNNGVVRCDRLQPNPPKASAEPRLAGELTPTPSRKNPTTITLLDSGMKPMVAATLIIDIRGKTRREVDLIYLATSNPAVTAPSARNASSEPVVCEAKPNSVSRMG